LGSSHEVSITADSMAQREEWEEALPGSGTPSSSSPSPESGTNLSAGSRLHQAGRCKPCAFFHARGCLNGVDCAFCHECPPQEAQRRKRVKRQLLRPLMAAAVTAPGTSPASRAPGVKAGHQRQPSDASTAASSNFSHSRQSSGSSAVAVRDEFEGFAEGAAPYCMPQSSHAPQMVGFAVPYDSQGGAVSMQTSDGMGGQPQVQYMLVPISQVMPYPCSNWQAAQ